MRQPNGESQPDGPSELGPFQVVYSFKYGYKAMHFLLLGALALLVDLALVEALSRLETRNIVIAGSAVIATLTLALSAGASFEEAAHLANHAGGLVVMKRGTATVSASELRYAISGGSIGRPA